MAGVALLSLLLAYASWRWVETPMRQRGRLQRRQVFVLAAAGSAAFLALGAAGHLARGFPGRLPAAAQVSELDMPRVDNGWCFYSVDSLPQLAVGAAGQGCWRGAATRTRRALLFGDSFAAQYEPLWHRAGQEGGLAVHMVSTNWCHPAFGDAFTGPRSSPAYAQCLDNRRLLQARAGDYELVILGAAWGNLLRRGQLDGALQALRELAARVPLVVVMPSPRQYDGDVTAAFQRSRMHGEAFDIADFPAAGDALSVAAHARLQAEAARHANVVFVPREDLFGAGARLPDLAADGIPFSLEGWHISIHGARRHR
ncbi:acyltransferase, partial [Rubrivivax gelatinosus]|nr:acyltransferase [Rubrivivax gelatinosus]